MKEKLKNLRKRKNKFPVVFTSVFVIGYVLLFSSKLWFPGGSDFIKATTFYEIQKYSSYDMYISAWNYSPSQNRMEITIEWTNNEVLDKSFVYEAVSRARHKTEKIKVVPMVEDSSFVILQLQEVPENWQEVSLRIGESKEVNPLKLYTNIESIHTVKKIKQETEQQYRIQRFKHMINRNLELISKLESEISVLEKNISNLQIKIKELRHDLEYEIDEEQEITTSKIGKAEGEIQTNQESIDKIKIEIEELNQKNVKLEEQISTVN